MSVSIFKKLFRCIGALPSENILFRKLYNAGAILLTRGYKNEAFNFDPEKIPNVFRNIATRLANNKPFKNPKNNPDTLSIPLVTLLILDILFAIKSVK
jgi:predicted tellurium resistance membrane protein TerC